MLRLESDLEAHVWSYEVIVGSKSIHQLLNGIVAFHASHHLLPIPYGSVQPLYDFIVRGVACANLRALNSLQGRGRFFHSNAYMLNC